MDKLIISAAVTGSSLPKAKSPFHPVSPDEIVEAAVEAWRAGAAIVHLHSRDRQGMPCADAEAYRELVARIRGAGCEAILNLSAGDAGGRASTEQRLRVAEAGAEIVSLDCGTLNLGGRVYMNPPDYLLAMAERMKRNGVKPEIEIFDTGEVAHALGLVNRGLIARPLFFQFVFGLEGSLPVNERQLLLMLDYIPRDAVWSVAIPSDDVEAQLRLSLIAFALGGHVRTGMEDNVCYLPGRLARSNAELVGRWAEMAPRFGREVASAAEARRLLGLA
jgi:3-keto-5-aminohexanoate cleavage enzyme